MKYSEMSDKEINTLVIRALGLRLYQEKNEMYESLKSQFDCGNDSSLFVKDGEIGCEAVDYCNNPSDAWPIIFDNRISLQVTNLPDVPWHAIGGEKVSESAHQITSWGGFSVQDYNPLRAAMICFLKMKDDQQ